MISSQDYILKQIDAIRHLMAKILKANSVDELIVLFEQTNEKEQILPKLSNDGTIDLTIAEEQSIGELAITYTSMIKKMKTLISESTFQTDELCIDMFEKAKKWIAYYHQHASTFDQRVVDAKTYLELLENSIYMGK